MNLLNMSKIEVIHRGSTGLAATDLDCTALVDMKGYESCLLLVSCVESTAGMTTGTLQLQPRHSSVNTSTTGITDLGSTAIAGTTALTTGHIGKFAAVDIYRPTKRYITASIQRTGADTLMLSPVFAILYNHTQSPTSQSTGEVIQAKTLIAPTT